VIVDTLTVVVSVAVKKTSLQAVEAFHRCRCVVLDHRRKVLEQVLVRIWR
jgi:hypothetical protein